MSMVKALTQIVSVDIGQNLVSMSVVDKQNQSGIKFNERLFVVVHGVFFGYISKVKMNEQPNKINIAEAKVKVPMKNLYSIEVQAETMIVKFTIQENGKLVPKEWVLKTASEKLAAFWKQLLEYQLKMRSKSPPPKKQSSSIAKDKPNADSSAVNQSSDRKSSVSPQKPIETSSAKVEKHPQQPKKQPKKQQKKPAKVFENPLFEDSGSQQEETSKKKPSPIKKKPPPIQINEESQKKNLKQKEKPNPVKENVETKVQKSAMEQPPKKKEPIALKLQKIEQQLIEQTPNNKKQSISKVQPKEVIKSDLKLEKSIKKQTKKPSKDIPSKQQGKSPQKFDLGIKQSQFINSILKELQQKNKKFPFQQLAYSHQQIEKIVKLYGKDLNEASNQNNKTEALLKYIVETLRAKMEKTGPKVNLPEGTPWIYKQILMDQESSLLNFHIKCKALMKTLYTELHNRVFHTFKEVKKERNAVYYQTGDIEARVPLIGHKQPNGSSIQLLDGSTQKKVGKQFKCWKYLYKVVANKGVIKVPYSCLCEYGGIVALFRVKTVVMGEKEKEVEDMSGDDLLNLEKTTKLPLRKILKNRLKLLNQFHYNEFRSGDTNINFKFCVVEQLQNLYAWDLNSVNRQQGDELRMQLVEQQLNTVLPYLERKDVQNPDKEEAKTITELCQIAKKRVGKLAHYLEGGQFYFVSPDELIHLLHRQGINMRYLKELYIQISDSFMKSMLASEMVARSIKQIFRKTMQDECFETLQSDIVNLTFEQYSGKLKDKWIDFMNCIFGLGEQSNTLWQLIMANMQHKLGVRVSRDEVSKGQLLISVAQHCGMLLNFQAIDAESMFTTNSFLTKECLKENTIKMKGYHPVSCTVKQELNSTMSEISHQNFNKVTNRLKLKQSKLPKELQLYPNLINQLKVYLSNFIQPQQVDWSNNYSHLSVYDWQHPCRFSLASDLSMLRWYLRSGRRQKYLNKFSQVTNKIAKLYGNNYPFLSQMYELFSDHHKSKGQVQDSINFMKSSLLNYSALYGDNNIKVAESYYKLATLLISQSRQSQGEEYLRKAKQIFDHLRKDKSLLQGKVRLSLALIIFKEEKYKECLDLLQNIKDLFDPFENNPSNNYQVQRTQIYQLLYYCQSKQNYKVENVKLCTSLESKLKGFKDHNNYGEILCIIIDYYMNSITTQAKQTMKNLIQMIPTKMSINFYKKSYQLIQKRYAQKNLFGSFKKYSENANKIVEVIQQKNLLKVWENLSKIHERETLFDFISLVEELIYFLGRDRLNAI